MNNIYKLQHYTNKLKYEYIKNLGDRDYFDGIVSPKIGKQEWIYEINWMSNLTLCIYITVITDENRYSVSRCITHDHLYHINIPVRIFAKEILEDLLKCFDDKYLIKMLNEEGKERFSKMFINDFWSVFEREYFNYFGQ